MEVAIPMGIPNHAIPPIKNALTLVWGVLAMALCQYAYMVSYCIGVIGIHLHTWSLKTVCQLMSLICAEQY